MNPTPLTIFLRVPDESLIQFRNSYHTNLHRIRLVLSSLYLNLEIIRIFKVDLLIIYTVGTVILMCVKTDGEIFDS